MPKTYKNFRLTCLAGLIVSLYATYVKFHAEKDTNYKALCDVAPKISCTAVFRSYYGRGFGLSQYIFGATSQLNLSNGLVGLMYYIFLFISSYFIRKWICLIQFGLIILTNFLSLYLAYLLFFVLDEYCLVCFLIYAINKFLLIEIWQLYKHFWRKNKNTNKVE